MGCSIGCRESQEHAGVVQDINDLASHRGNHSELRAAEPEGHREGDKQAGAHAIKVTTRVGGNPSSPSSTFLFRQAIR